MMEIPPLTFFQQLKHDAIVYFFLLALIQQQHDPFLQLRREGDHSQNPCSPLGSKLIYPGQSASTTRLSLPGLQPPRSYGTGLNDLSRSKTMANSCNNFALFSASVAPTPAKRADQTPGKPPKISTFKGPESSAKTVFPVSSAIVSAFRRHSLQRSSCFFDFWKLWVLIEIFHFKAQLSKILRNSLVFPSFRVAIKNRIFDLVLTQKGFKSTPSLANASKAISLFSTNEQGSLTLYDFKSSSLDFIQDFSQKVRKRKAEP